MADNINHVWRKHVVVPRPFKELCTKVKGEGRKEKGEGRREEGGGRGGREEGSGRREYKGEMGGTKLTIEFRTCL